MRLLEIRALVDKLVEEAKTPLIPPTDILIELTTLQELLSPQSIAPSIRDFCGVLEACIADGPALSRDDWRLNDLVDRYIMAARFQTQVIEAHVVNHTLAAHHHHDPERAVAELIEYEVTMALDPAISKVAQALVERGKTLSSPGQSAERAFDLLGDLGYRWSMSENAWVHARSGIPTRAVMALVPMEVWNFYRFAATAFVPMTSQQVELNNSLALAVKAVKGITE
jgi:hypothetical protein